MKHAGAVGLLILLAAGSAAAQKLAPGLWEHTVTVKSDDGRAEAAMAQMQQQLAAMPPEQRKKIEEMMARRGMGVGGKPNAVRVCISPEMASRDELPQGNEGRCKRQSLQRSGNTVRFKFVCEGNPPSSGEGEFTYAGNKAYSGRTVLDRVVKGQPQRTEVQMEGRFVASDCGDVKPRDLKP